MHRALGSSTGAVGGPHVHGRITVGRITVGCGCVRRLPGWTAIRILALDFSASLLESLPLHAEARKGARRVSITARADMFDEESGWRFCLPTRHSVLRSAEGARIVLKTQKTKPAQRLQKTSITSISALQNPSSSQIRNNTATTCCCEGLASLAPACGSWGRQMDGPLKRRRALLAPVGT